MQGGEKRYSQAPQEWQVHPIQMRIWITSNLGAASATASSRAAVAIAGSGGGRLNRSWD
jgi:hypothetical protein